MTIALHLLSALLLPFLFAGVILRVKSFWAGRRGPSIAQPFYDLVRLLKKSDVTSTSASFVFRIAPPVILTAMVAVSLIIPLGSASAMMPFAGDFIFAAFLLSLANFFLIASALDVGSSFEGMGASREATFALVTEPAALFIFASVVYGSTSRSLTGMLASLRYTDAWSATVIVLIAIAFFIILLAEGKRVPVDDPATHLELTMIHEVMLLDTSGPNLAFMTFASNLKMTLYAAIIAQVLLPTLPPLLFAIAFFGIVIIIAAAVGCVESFIARFRMTHVPQFLLLPLAIGIFVLVMSIIRRGGMQ